MASLSGSFTGTGQTSTVLLLRSLTSAGYTLGAFASGSVYLERTTDGGLSWQVVATHTAVVSAGYYENEFKAQDVYLRLRSASGTTIAWTLADNTGEALAELVVNDDHGNLRYYVDDQGFFRANGFKDFAGLAIVTGGLASLNGLTAETQTFAVGTSGTAPAVSSSGGVHTFNTPMASASSVTAGLISKTDYDSFAAKQAAGNYVTALTGEVTAVGPGSVAATITNSAVIGKVITGFSSGAGALAATDTILQAINKLDGNIAAKQTTGNYITALTGEVTASGPGSVAATVTNSAVIGKVLTGYVSGSGTVAATDTILQAIQKLNGNDALKANSASPAFTTQVTFGNYRMEPSEQDAGNSSTADTIDLSLGSAIKSTLTGNVTYTLSNPVTGGTYVFRILTGAGSFTVTWPATVKWSLDQGAYVATTTASRMDLVSLYWDGTNYYGSYVKGFTP